MQARTDSTAQEAPKTKTLTPEQLRVELEAIRRAHDFATPEQLAAWLDSPQVRRELDCSEIQRPHSFWDRGGLTVAEDDLCFWLAKEVAPAPHPDDPQYLIDWIDPKVGGGTLETHNGYRAAWWLSHQRLRARLLEFLALDIPQPREITQEDVETARAEASELHQLAEVNGLPTTGDPSVQERAA